ncbi:Lanthionine synthetase C-like protein [Actinopolyspora alba]|uniref:Lanthionine synthetase C-like protein n=1 Tax=Actinopolyspora alba TaxID=673379 RepID=A0A1I2C663_9ACTN|nr:lanthionine synthetase C family protein [Actinopolyspora alba]SFE63836.1 Lanthionine synthetase C-like protein [Actinopolyspora alba]
MTHTATQALEAAADIVHNLAYPDQFARTEASDHSLASGAAGISLLHSERAASGHDDWASAHTWLTTALSGDLSAGDEAGLFFGAPACAFAAHFATRTRPGILTRALSQLDTSISELTRRRLAAAHTRIDRGHLAAFREYDLMRGLTGIGAYHLRRNHHDSTRAVLSYLVRLTHPGPDGLPGWWVDHAPSPDDPDPAFTPGHANLGMAHGIAGPLALLAQAARRGITVAGHFDALDRVCAWLDTWQQPHPAGPWWPYWITRAQLRGNASVAGPGRPSWCYGTPGLARAQQLAALALRDTARQRTSEAALLGCLTDPKQRSSLTEPGLCHGLAGLLQTTWRMAEDAVIEDLGEHLPLLITRLTEHRHTDSPEFLTGAAGIALTLHTTTAASTDSCVWDTSLLLS